MAKKNTIEDSTAPAVTPAALPGDNAGLQALVAQLLQQNQELMLRVIDANAPKAAPESPLFRIENACGARVAFEVTDEKTLQPVHIVLEERGSFRLLTRDQIMELYHKTTEFFDRGYVVAPEVIEPSANVIPDIGKFLDALPLREINARIEQITALNTLFDIYHYIENLRYRSTDDHGQPILDRELQPMMEELDIDPKYESVALQVQRVIRKRHGINASLTSA